MTERTRLGTMILNHWRENAPQMVKDLEKQNRLEQAVNEAQERTGDLLYELLSAKKLDYQAAWELAMREWALPPGGSLERRRRRRDSEPGAGTGGPVAGLPDNAMRTASARAG